MPAMYKQKQKHAQKKQKMLKEKKILKLSAPRGIVVSCASTTPECLSQQLTNGRDEFVLNVVCDKQS